VLVALAAAAAGCATLPAAPPAQRTYEGRFSATARLHDRSENVSGRFSLHVHAEALTLDLVSALGNTLARFELAPGIARIRAPDSAGRMQDFTGASAEDLSQRLLGFALPAAGIAHWIEGRPAPQPPPAAVVAGPGGLVTAIEQDGWSITVDDRFNGAGAPRRLTLTRPARPGTALQAPAPAVTLRLLLDAPSA
jgi:outer membrane biogenesis lipoprotein LolB